MELLRLLTQLFDEWDGHGEISQILNDHYSAVTFPEGTKFSEGDVVEKHTH